MSGPGDDRYVHSLTGSLRATLTLHTCYRWRGGLSRQSSQRHAGNGNRGGHGGNRGGNAAWNASAPAQDQHVPVRGFNAAEAKNLLKKGRIGRAHQVSCVADPC